MRHRLTGGLLNKIDGAVRAGNEDVVEVVHAAVFLASKNEKQVFGSRDVRVRHTGRRHDGQGTGGGAINAHFLQGGGHGVGASHDRVVVHEGAAETVPDVGGQNGGGKVARRQPFNERIDGQRLGAGAQVVSRAGEVTGIEQHGHVGATRAVVQVKVGRGGETNLHRAAVGEGELGFHHHRHIERLPRQREIVGDGMQGRAVRVAVVEHQIQPAAARGHPDAAGGNFKRNDRAERLVVNERAVRPIAVRHGVGRVGVLARSVEVKTDGRDGRDGKRGRGTQQRAAAIGHGHTDQQAVEGERHVGNGVAAGGRSRYVHAVGLPLVAQGSEDRIGGDTHDGEDGTITHGRGLAGRLGADGGRRNHEEEATVGHRITGAGDFHGIRGGIRRGDARERERGTGLSECRTVFAPDVGERSRPARRGGEDDIAPGAVGLVGGQGRGRGAWLHRDSARRAIRAAGHAVRHANRINCGRGRSVGHARSGLSTGCPEIGRVGRARRGREHARSVGANRHGIHADRGERVDRDRAGSRVRAARHPIRDQHGINRGGSRGHRDTDCGRSARTPEVARRGCTSRRSERDGTTHANGARIHADRGQRIHRDRAGSRVRATRHTVRHDHRVDRSGAGRNGDARRGRAPWTPEIAGRARVRRRGQRGGTARANRGGIGGKRGLRIHGESDDGTGHGAAVIGDDHGVTARAAAAHWADGDAGVGRVGDQVGLVKIPLVTQHWVAARGHDERGRRTHAIGRGIGRSVDGRRSRTGQASAGEQQSKDTGDFHRHGQGVEKHGNANTGGRRKAPQPRTVQHRHTSYHAVLGSDAPTRHDMHMRCLGEL